MAEKHAQKKSPILRKKPRPYSCSGFRARARSCHFWPFGTRPFFWRLSCGTQTERFTPLPSLCTELTCSALALIIYSERERRGVSAFCLQGSTSVSSFNLQVLWHFSSHTILVSHHALPPSLSVSSISLLFCLSFKISLCRSCSFICLLVVQTARLFSEMLCRCAVLYFACQETEIIFFHVCSTPIILPGVTDGSPLQTALVRILCYSTAR